MSQKAVERLQSQFAKLDKDTVDDAMRALLAHANGRKFLWNLLRIGKVGVQPFTANALTTSFNCGEMNVGQQILDHIIEVDPAGYVQMMKESEDERSTRDTALRGAYSQPDNGNAEPSAGGDPG